LRVSTNLRVSTAARDILTSWVGQARAIQTVHAVANLRGKAAIAQHDLPNNSEVSQHEAVVVSQPPTYAQVLVGQQSARGTPAALQDRKQPREQHTTGYSLEKKVVRRAVSDDQRKLDKGKCPACVKRLMNQCPIVLANWIGIAPQILPKLS
jgi:hypothetical protein